MAYRILIVDDEPEMVQMLSRFLSRSGYEIIPAFTGEEAVASIKAHPDIILLDINMPGMDGISVCKEVRDKIGCPILFLTAKDQEADKIEGFTAGGDDYITKPFNPIEVIARVKSQLRRYTTLGGRSGPQDRPDLLSNGGITVDDGAKSVTVDGEPVSLTPIEYNILLLLIRHQGRVFSTGQIYEQVWNDPSLGSENTVAVHIRHLREKLEIDPANPRYIKVVWGLGYKMEKL